MKIKIKEVLMWYDGPYLFVGESELKKLFLGIKVRLEGGNGYNFKYLFAETNKEDIKQLKQGIKCVDSVFREKVSYIGELECSYEEINTEPYTLDKELDKVFFDGSLFLDKEDYE